MTGPTGATSTVEHDGTGRVVATTDALGRRSTTSYDAAGRPVTHADPSGRTLRWTYDASGRVERFGPDDGSSPVVLQRDVLGRVVQVDEADLTHRLAWDRNGRLVERRRGDLALAWTYDADGRTTALQLPDGTTTTSEHDAGGRLSATQHPATGRTTLHRDADGRLLEARTPTGTHTWAYEDGVLSEHATVQDGRPWLTRLLRDAGGRLAGVDRDGRLDEYAYDEAGQLVSVSSGAEALTFSYDAGGRLQAETSGASEWRYEYDLAAQLVASWAPDGTRTEYRYDGAGRRTHQRGDGVERVFSWDGHGRLSGVSDSRRGDTSVRVDAFGELAEVGGTSLLWDAADPLSPLLWAGDAPVVHAGPASARPGADWGSTERTSAEGRDPWGAPAAPGGAELGAGGELEFAGLSWLRARAYDPSTRALLTPDPLPPVPGAAWAENPYSYAGNDPVGAADPLGLRPVSDAELRAYRDRVGQNPFAAAGRSLLDGADGVLDRAGRVFDQGRDWVVEHKEYIAAGALAVAGVALMFTGVGGPAGVALLAASGAALGAAGSIAVQQATTGHVDWSEVGVSAAIGAVTAPLGALAGGLEGRRQPGRPWCRGRGGRERGGRRAEPGCARREPPRPARAGCRPARRRGHGRGGWPLGLAHGARTSPRRLRAG